MQSGNRNGNARLGRVLRWITVALGALVVVALVRSLRRDGPAAFDAWRSADVQWSWVLLASAFALAGHIVFVIGWQRLLKDCGVPVSFWRAARIFLASNRLNSFCLTGLGATILNMPSAFSSIMRYFLAWTRS